jgi:glutamate-5-semialdehyde dehydrogenase
MSSCSAPSAGSGAALADVASRARAAANALGASCGAERDKALSCVAAELSSSRAAIEAANREDKAAAEREGLGAALRARLNLEGDKFSTLLAGLREVRACADPVGVVSLARELDHGLELYRVSCPIGVLCVIFESRPEAAVQIASLALKSGNAVILKGGREALRSNAALVDAFRRGLRAAGLPEDAVQLVSTREDVSALLRLDQYIDLVIPRGSNQLVRSVMDATKIPVMGHADGICAVYVDRGARLSTALAVVVDAKTQYVAACNTAETLLVDAGRASELVPALGRALVAAGVKLRACDKSLPLLLAAGCAPDAVAAARPLDFRTEFLALEMAVKVVLDVRAAIQHINEHGSHHTDCIVTEDGAAAELFMEGVSSAGVYHNCSTRFADGFRYGFGAEVGVSTGRIHARGPVGLEGLLTYKYRLHGHGQCVKSYGGADGRVFTHRALAPTSGRAPRLDADTRADAVAAATRKLLPGSGMALGLALGLALGSCLTLLLSSAGRHSVSSARDD